MNKRLSMWKSRQLSIGGRLTLVNSVLTSIPLYYLSFFKFPTWLIKSMDKIRRNFLWGGTGSSSPCKSLVKWSLVCKPKSVGGLGVLNLQDFNLALLSKWVWKVLHNASYCGKVFNSLYSFHPNNRGTHPSQLASRFWKDCFSSSQALRSLVHWRLGEGSIIRFWEDKWTGYNSLASLYPEASQLAFSSNSSVRSQGCMHSNSWRWHPLIRRPTSASSVAGVQALKGHLTSLSPIPYHVRDKVIWPFHASESFTVSSLYKLISGIFALDKDAGFIWKIVAPSKVKIFVWILYKRKLNTKLNLARKGWMGDVYCPLCLSSPESDDHLFQSCSYVREVWSYFTPYMQQPPLLQDLSSTLHARRDSMGNAPDKKLWSILFPTLCWCIWRTRNNHLFKGVLTSPRKLVSIITHFIILWTGTLASKSAAATFKIVKGKGLAQLMQRDDYSSCDMAVMEDNFSH